MQNIKPEYYKELDEEFKRKYKEYVGVEPTDTSNSFFTEKQQIERYAKNIAFWKKELVDATFDSDGKTLARSFMISQAHSNIMNKIKKKFSPEIQKKIIERVEQLLDDKRNDELKKIKKKLNIIYNVACAYYKEAKNNICDEDTCLIDPVVWISNQDMMREIWENFKNDCIGEMLINNSFGTYMQFMYDSYPPNFQNETKRRIDEFGCMDGAEIYYDLTKKLNCSK